MNDLIEKKEDNYQLTDTIISELRLIDEEVIKKEAKYIKIIIKGDPGYLGSISFYNNSNKMLPITTIKSSSIYAKNLKNLS